MYIQTLTALPIKLFSELTGDKTAGFISTICGGLLRTSNTSGLPSANS